MSSVTVTTLQEQVTHVIHNRTKLPAFKLVPTAYLNQDLGLDALQVVEIIWALEKRFQVEIPDDVPLLTVGDFISFLEKAGK
jgi:acyl carrier protein